MELIDKEGIAKVVAIEERNVDVSKRVTMEIRKKGKHQDGYSVPSRTTKKEII